VNNKVLKILHIASGDIWAGAEKQLFHLIKMLNEHRTIEVKVFLFNEGVLSEKLSEIGVDVYICNENKNSGIVLTQQIFNKCAKDNIKIMHAHGYKSHILSLPVKYLFRNIVLIRTMHGAIETKPRKWDLQGRMLFLLEKFAIKHSDSIIAVSLQLKEYLLSLYNIENIKIIENGIDVEETISDSRLQSEITLDDKNKLKVALIGRLTPVKNPLFFTQIQEELIKKSNHDYIFYIIGTGPEEDSIKEYIKEHKLDGKVILTGFVENVPSILSGIDVLLITSIHEGLPIILLEAMTLGVVVISISTGGIPNVISNYENGFLIPSHNIFQFIDSLESVLNNHSLRNKIQIHAMETIRDKYSIDTSGKKYLEVYDEYGN